MIKIIGILIGIGILSYLSAKAYRFGGSAKKGDWLDILRNKATRRFGCMILRVIAIYVLGTKAPNWIWLISCGIAYGGLTTYWDSVFGEDNHFAHGFGIGMAALPFAIIGSISWVAFGVHIFVITSFMGFWSLYHDNDVKEEYGRGSAVIWTQLALLIP